MDDDIELNCGHVATAAAFLSYSRSQMVVGGQMLDLFDRCLMSEAGGQVSGLNIVKPNHEQLHLLDQESLRAIGRVSLTHYNGWWFAAIPADAFRAHGMPLPIFIRGDDMEFGIRLRRAGVPTVSLPPISVWHEPFYATPPGWKHYYDLRNRLIFASIYPEHCRLDSALRLFKILLAMIVRYDYQYIEIIRQALADFLEGPRVLRAQAEKHATVLRLLQRCVPEVLEYGAELPAASAAPAGRAAGRVRLLISLVRALGGWPARDLAGRECAVDPQALRHRMRLGRSYVLADPGGRYFLRFRYSLRRSWGGLARTVPMIFRYRLRRGATAARWKAAFPDLVGQENWERRLGLRPEVEPLHERPQAAEDRQRKWSPRPAVRTSPPIGRSTM
jgi:galactofuranosylgalactofuranosylrhamnosyl-N-acetylglucosaminyl-diphospho-decaprenol beta-1,5/1,6-galactofuranosyltransferase